jgi:hypothetical protein
MRPRDARRGGLLLLLTGALCEAGPTTTAAPSQPVCFSPSPCFVFACVYARIDSSEYDACAMMAHNHMAAARGTRRDISTRRTITSRPCVPLACMISPREWGRGGREVST